MRKVVWRKASQSTSTGGECVEVADLSGNVGVRDSRDPGGPLLVVRRDVFTALVKELK